MGALPAAIALQDWTILATMRLFFAVRRLAENTRAITRTACLATADAVPLRCSGGARLADRLGYSGNALTRPARVPPGVPLL